MYSFQRISEILQVNPARTADTTTTITELAYDSRKITHPKQAMFFALKATRDGHDFIPDAYNRGVRNFIVTQIPPVLMRRDDVNVIRVSDPLLAMQQVSKSHRDQFQYPIIGITGSNGKSIVKAWLFQLLAPDSSVYQSPKSYNSQLGVALSLWHLSENYDMALIEAGISQPGEMKALAEMIQPTIGVLTNIGAAHHQYFDSTHQKLQEKLLLFRHCESVIAGSAYLKKDDLPASVKLITWGIQETDDLQLIRQQGVGPSYTRLTLRFNQHTFHIQVPFIDSASIENLLTCITVLGHLGYSTETISNRIGALRPLEMRLQLKKGIHQTSVIDDSYSNDIASLAVSLEFLAQQNQHKRQTLILSEMEGLSQIDGLGEQLVALINRTHLNRLIWVGPGYSWLSTLETPEVITFPGTAQLLEELPQMSFQDETILVKGARVYQFERVVSRLSARSHGTVLEINLNAIANNLMVYRSQLGRDVRLMAMVKAFSYGSGSFEIANLLQFSKVDYLTVAFADEGVDLRNSGITLPIMVLSPDKETFGALLEHRLEPEIYSLEILEAFTAFLKEQQATGFPIHLKLDTGMHRLGFLPDELDQLLAHLENAKELTVKSVFTHLVASGDPAQDEFTSLQIDRYKQAAERIEAGLGYAFIRHVANTSAITRWPGAHFDMVRLGIGLYGVDLHNSLPSLQQVSRLKTTVTQLKSLSSGETVGYDRKGVLIRDSQIATVKIGYADGYPRRFGNGVGKMQIQGSNVQTVGSICMDMCMLDVTGLEVRVGDEVDVYPDINQAAADIQTIPYELLVNVSDRVKRIYYYE